MAVDRRNYRQLVDTTVEIANRVRAAEIIGRTVDDLKDKSEQYRKMVMESMEKILGNLGEWGRLRKGLHVRCCAWR